MPEESPRKSSRWFTCLVKGPLGCGAFLFGASVVFVLFLPSALGRLGDRGLERWFARHFEGSLELGEVWIGSLYNRQRIESLIVRDPNGEEVLRGSLRAPPLGMLFAGGTDATIELLLSNMHLVEFADGSTNLERAFRPREDAGSGDVAFELPERVGLSVRIDRLRWSDARGRGGLLADLTWNGSLEAHARGTAVVLEGGSDASLEHAFSLALDYQSPVALGNGPFEGRSTLTGRELPLGLVRHVAACALPPGLFDGDNVDELSFARSQERGTLHVRDGALELEVSGQLEAELVRGEAGAPARLRVPLGSAVGEFVLARTVPFLVPTVLAGEGPVDFALADFVLPRDGDWERLEGELRFRLPAGTFGFDPAAVAALGGGFDLAPLDFAATVTLAGGRVDLAGLALPLERGMLVYDGESQLATGRIEVSFTHSLDGVDTPLGRWGGRAGAMVPAAPTPPVVPQTDAR